MNNIGFTVYRYFLNTLWVILLWVVFASSVGGIALPLTEKQKQVISFFFPEGWGFFTKNPRSETLADIYKINKDGLELVNVTNTSLANFLGLSRKSRFIGAEYSKISLAITDQISPKDWTVVKNWNEKKIIPHQVHKLEIKTQFKYLKSGDYLLVKYKTVPWAWVLHGQEVYNKFWLLRFTL